jgi:malate dehydrogenase (oxaloacetate-decarboxylating)(NADP+)
VRRIYKNEDLEFGPRYIIPKPFDPRVLATVASAVAEAAMRSGVARKTVDLDEYRAKLAARLDSSQEVLQLIIRKAQADPRRIVFPEGDEEKILRAAHLLREEKIAEPVLIGTRDKIIETAERIRVPHQGLEIIDPSCFDGLDAYAEELYNLRQRKGVTRKEAFRMLRDRMYFGAMMVRRGEVAGMVAGVTRHYPDTLRPALQVVNLRPGIRRVSGLYMLIIKRKPYFLADTTVNIETTAEDLAEIALLAAERVRRLDIEPRVAMLSFSNFGSAPHPFSDKVRRAVDLVQKADPDLMVDGEMQADTALNPDLMETFFPFSKLKGQANVLIFPSLEAANISYKLLSSLAGARAIGPILMGMDQPVAVLQKGFDVQDIATMAAIAVVDSQEESGAIIESAG